MSLEILENLHIVQQNELHLQILHFLFFALSIHSIIHYEGVRLSSVFFSFLFFQYANALCAKFRRKLRLRFLDREGSSSYEHNGVSKNFFMSSPSVPPNSRLKIICAWISYIRTYVYPPWYSLYLFTSKSRKLLNYLGNETGISLDIETTSFTMGK